MQALQEQAKLKIEEDPKHEGLNEADPSLNVKDKQAQEHDGGDDVAPEFDAKAKALGTGIEATNEAKIESSLSVKLNIPFQKRRKKYSIFQYY